jgi:hypothetical protein
MCQRYSNITKSHHILGNPALASAYRAYLPLAVPRQQQSALRTLHARCTLARQQRRYRSSGCESRVCHGQSFTGVPILRRRETLLKSVYTHHIHNSLDTSVAPLSSSLLHNLHRCFAPAPNNAKSVTPPSPLLPPSLPPLFERHSAEHN